MSTRLVPNQIARRQHALITFDQALAAGLSHCQVRHRIRSLARLAGAPGRRPAAVHELLVERRPGYDPGESDLETHVLRVIVAHGFPPPVQQHRVRVGGRRLRIDLAYPARRIAIELDGWEFHRSRTAFDDDRTRANLLVAHGWTLVRFTSRSSEAEIAGCLGAFGQLASEWHHRSTTPGSGVSVGAA